MVTACHDGTLAVPHQSRAEVGVWPDFVLLSLHASSLDPSAIPLQGLPLIRSLIALIVTFAGLQGCAHAPLSVPQPPPLALDGMHLHVHVASPERGGFIEVTIDLVRQDGLPRPLRVAFPHRWAGREDLSEDITSIAVTHRGAPMPWTVDDDAVIAIDHPDLQTLRVAYRLDPMAGLLSRATRFRALLSHDRFYAPGHALIAQPLDGVAAPVHVRLSEDTEAWALRSTLPEPTAIDDLEPLLDAAWFAGPLQSAAWTDGRRTVRVAADPGVSLPSHAIAEATAAVIDAQRGLLGERLSEQTQVLVLARDDAMDVRSGSGRTGGFVLELGARIDHVDDDLIALIAHENLHRLIGHALRIAPTEHAQTAWFVEGVTEYLARLTASRAGLLPTTRFFERISEALTAFEGNPARSRSSAEREATTWSDSDVRRLPYDLGVLLALSIDLELRASGAHSLEGWLRALREASAVDEVRWTNERLRTALEAYSGRSWAAYWEAYVIGTTLPPLHGQLDALGLAIVERLVPAPYFGVSWGREGTQPWRVTWVAPASPAERAGLRVGQELASEPWVPEGTDATEAWFEAVTASGVRRVTLRADVGQRRTFALVEQGQGGRVTERLGLEVGVQQRASEWRQAPERER